MTENTDLDLNDLSDHFPTLNIKGDDIQKLSVLNNLPHLAQSDQKECYSRVIPKIQQLLTASPVEFHIAASKMFKNFLELNIPADVLVNSALQNLENRDPVIVNTWLEALILGIPLLSWDIVCNEILPVAKHKSESCENATYRLMSARLLGKIAAHPKANSLVVQKDVLPAVISLCQDVNSEIRAAMCQQIPGVCQGIGGEKVKNCLLPSIVELAADENTSVRIITVSVIVQVFPFLDKETMKSTIVPLVLKLCEACVRGDEASRATFAREIGRICHGLDPFLSTMDAAWFVSCYKQLAVQGTSQDVHMLNSLRDDPMQDVTCRQQCAYNLPAMTTYTLSACSGQLEELYRVLASLVNDSCYLVRCVVASGMSDITAVLGAHVRMVLDDIVHLLRDDSEDVLEDLVPHITNILMQLSKQNILQVNLIDGTIIEIGRALIKCNTSIVNTTNWRLRTLFLKQLECLPSVFPSDFIHTHFLPIIFEGVHKGRAKPCRQQAGRTLLKFLRYNSKSQQRLELRSRIVTELCNNKCSYTRNIYIRMCKELLELFSPVYFKEHFYIPLLTLTDDKVPNIRLCVVMLFPKLKSILRLPSDRKLLSLLEQAVVRLELHEKDRDCREILRSVIVQLARIQVRNDQDRFDADEQKLLDEESRLNSHKSLNTLPYPLQRKYSHTRKSSGHPNQRFPSQNISTRQSNASISTPRMAQNLYPRASSASPVSRRSNASGSHQSAKDLSMPYQSDMTILQQHFYIDAGVNIPIIHQMDNNSVSVFGYQKSSTSTKSSVDAVTTSLPKKQNNDISSKIATTNRPNKNKKVDESVGTGAIPKSKINRNVSKKRFSLIENNSNCDLIDTKNSALSSVNKRHFNNNYPGNNSAQRSNTSLHSRRRSLDMSSSKIPILYTSKSVILQRSNTDLFFEPKSKLKNLYRTDVVSSKIERQSSFCLHKNASTETNDRTEQLNSVKTNDTIKQKTVLGNNDSGNVDSENDVFMRSSEITEQKLTTESIDSETVAPVYTCETGVSSEKNLVSIDDAELRLRKSPNDNAFIINTKHRHSLAFDSGLPVPVRKK